ncbi:hypothetical protein TNCV_3200631 [Trichonephila clavipes]|nr:hypothetical protein TNCV_3200631 [Trichonephila clavipes]
MVRNRAVDAAVFNVTEAIRNAADAAIPKTSIPLESCANHGGTLPANKPKGAKEGVGDGFSSDLERNPTLYARPDLVPTIRYIRAPTACHMENQQSFWFQTLQSAIL